MDKDRVIAIDAKETKHSIFKDTDSWVVVTPDKKRIDVANFKPVQVEYNAD